MRTGVPLLVVATLSACASPYAYQKEISSFSSSITSASGAITEGLADIDQDQRTADLAVVVSSRTGVDFSEDCAKPAAKATGPCRLLPVGAPALPVVRANLVEPGKDLRRDLGILKAYTEGLAAVASAQDRKDYDAAAAQLASSMGALASAIPSGAGAAAAVALPAVVKFTAWVVGEGLDQARFDTLKSALNAVGNPLPGSTESPIEIVADRVIRNALTAIQSARMALLLSALQARGDRINLDLARAVPTRVSVERYDKPIIALDSDRGRLNEIRAINPAEVSGSLVDAHNKLRDAVNDPKTQYTNLVKSIIEFSEQADSLRKALTKSTAVSTK